LKTRAFTLVEVLITIAIIAIIASLLIPGINRSKEAARRTLCLNQLRQTQLSLQIYASEHGGLFPPRSVLTAWPNQMRVQLGNGALLNCPSDRISISTNEPNRGELGPQRSYIMNGFNDLYREALNDEDWKRFPKVNYNVHDSQIVQPQNTISFGEKNSTSALFYVDLLVAADYYTVLEERRHNRKGPRDGESNYAFFDGSVRQLKFGKSTCPENLWAVLDTWRKKESLCRPR
jgi:prepilin-type N-terminal cleavage/methylation domain-containing protein/prepilin-type processing-associated H-X9-DG protein